MPRYFTAKGMELFQQNIREQRARVEMAQQDAGEAAGPSYDWHDNFGYEDARRRTEMEASRLQELVTAANGAIVFEPLEQSDVARIGNTIAYWNSSLQKDQEVTLGGYGELDQGQGLISYESPIGQALLGHSKGDVVRLELGPNSMELIVKDIFPPSYRYGRLVDELLRRIDTK
jgi:transcription elongation factor GreA